MSVDLAPRAVRVPTHGHHGLRTPLRLHPAPADVGAAQRGSETAAVAGGGRGAAGGRAVAAGWC